MVFSSTWAQVWGAGSKGLRAWGLGRLPAQERDHGNKSRYGCLLSALGRDRVRRARPQKPTHLQQAGGGLVQHVVGAVYGQHALGARRLRRMPRSRRLLKHPQQPGLGGSREGGGGSWEETRLSAVQCRQELCQMEASGSVGSLPDQRHTPAAAARQPPGNAGCPTPTWPSPLNP